MYTVVLEDKFGHKSTPISASANVSSTVGVTTAPTLVITLPNGRQVLPGGAVDDRVILVGNARQGSDVQFQYALDGQAWAPAQGAKSCSPECTLDWNVALLPRGHYSVRVQTSTGTSLVGDFTLRGDTGLPAPGTPVAMITPFGVSLHWSPAQGELANRYAISRRSGGDWVVLDRVTGTTYLDSTAQSGINDYRVQAYDSDGAIGLASAIVTIKVPRVERSTAVTAQPQGTLAAPAGLHVVAGSGTLTLLWTAAPNAAGYIVKRAWQANGPFVEIGRTGETVYRDSAPIGAMGYYRVQAYSGITAPRPLMSFPR
jgi:hypothetical protein